MTVSSPVRTVFIVSMGGPEVHAPLEPNRPATVDVPASGVRDLNSYAYLLREHTDVDFTQYKRSTILRRIQRRMALRGVEGVGDCNQFQLAVTYRTFARLLTENCVPTGCVTLKLLSKYHA